MYLREIIKKLVDYIGPSQTLVSLSYEQIEEVAGIIFDILRCPECHGRRGKYSNAMWHDCEACNGKGYIMPPEKKYVSGDE